MDQKPFSRKAVKAEVDVLKPWETPIMERSLYQGFPITGHVAWTPIRLPFAEHPFTHQSLNGH